jgi:RNA polymerase sigma-70 factor (ECF subfamily)
MNETSLSLLNRLRGAPEPESWSRLVGLYAPLIRAWLRKYDVQESDAEDLVQEVLLAVSKDLGQFEHGGQPGAFRGWLKAILVNRLRKFWRARDRRPQARGDSDIDARLAQLARSGIANTISMCFVNCWPSPSRISPRQRGQPSVV